MRMHIMIASVTKIASSFYRIAIFCHCLRVQFLLPFTDDIECYKMRGTNLDVK